jgi:hypothetical protein
MYPRNLCRFPSVPTKHFTGNSTMQKGTQIPKFRPSLPSKWDLVTEKLGELIWPMTTCRPDLSQAVMKCASASAAPTETHYNAVKSIFRYLAATMKDGIHFWRTEPRMDLPNNELPKIHSTPHDLRMIGRPNENPLDLCGTWTLRGQIARWTLSQTGRRSNCMERKSLAYNSSFFYRSRVLRGE